MCPENIIVASKVKRFAIEASNSTNLSECKYYSLIASKLFSQAFNQKKSCNCIDSKNLNAFSNIKAAENSSSLSVCKSYSEKSIFALNNIVNNITNCQIK